MFTQDVRFALRTMRKTPAFTLMVIMLMALGIGVNAAVFAAVNGILLRPLPYANADHLVFVRENGPEHTSRDMRVGIPDFIDWRNQTTSFSDLAAYGPVSFNVAYGGEVERAQAQVVSSNFAQVLGVRPALGRFFAAEDDRPRPLAGRVEHLDDERNLLPSVAQVAGDLELFVRRQQRPVLVRDQHCRRDPLRRRREVAVFIGQNEVEQFLPPR